MDIKTVLDRIERLERVIDGAGGGHEEDCEFEFECDCDVSGLDAVRSEVEALKLDIEIDLQRAGVELVNS